MLVAVGGMAGLGSGCTEGFGGAWTGGAACGVLPVGAWLIWMTTVFGPVWRMVAIPEHPVIPAARSTTRIKSKILFICESILPSPAARLFQALSLSSGFIYIRVRNRVGR